MSSLNKTIRRQKELNNDTQEYLINDESDENELKTEQYNASTSVTESNSEHVFNMSLTSLILMAMTRGNRCGLCCRFANIGAFQDIIPWDKWTSNLWH